MVDTGVELVEGTTAVFREEGIIADRMGYLEVLKIGSPPSPDAVETAYARLNHLASPYRAILAWLYRLPCRRRRSAPLLCRHGLSKTTSIWPLSSNGAGSYGKASSFLNSLMGQGRIGDGVGRVPPMG